MISLVNLQLSTMARLGARVKPYSITKTNKTVFIGAQCCELYGTSRMIVFQVVYNWRLRQVRQQGTSSGVGAGEVLTAVHVASTGVRLATLCCTIL